MDNTVVNKQINYSFTATCKIKYYMCLYTQKHCNFLK